MAYVFGFVEAGPVDSSFFTNLDDNITPFYHYYKMKKFIL